MIVGFILLIIGIVFLLKNLGYISDPAWGIIWPVILIILGLGILLKRIECDFFLARLENFWKKKKRLSKKKNK